METFQNQFFFLIFFSFEFLFLAKFRLLKKRLIMVVRCAQQHIMIIVLVLMIRQKAQL